MSKKLWDGFRAAHVELIASMEVVDKGRMSSGIRSIVVGRRS
jgi:hypothetical protein